MPPPVRSSPDRDFHGWSAAAEGSSVSPAILRVAVVCLVLRHCGAAQYDNGIDRITTPLLLMTGGEDHNVPAINTREMYYALRRLGKPVTWVNYSNGGHGAPNTTEADITDWHQRILDWYAKYLSPPLPVR